MNLHIALTCAVICTTVSKATAKYLALPAGSFGSDKAHGIYYSTVTEATPHHRALQFEMFDQNLTTYDIGAADCWYQMQNGFDEMDDVFVCEQYFTPSQSTMRSEMIQGNCTDVSLPPPEFCREWNHTKCCQDALEPERTLSDFVGFSPNLEVCMELCTNYTYFGRQGYGECWCGNDLVFDHGSLDTDCDCNGTNVGALIECVYSKIHRVTVDFSRRPTPNPRNEGIVETSVKIKSWPPKDADGITRITFCMITTLADADGGYDMQMSRTPFESEFHYDGNFDIEFGIYQNGPGPGADQKMLYTAEAFVCDPSTFTESTAPIRIGGVLYVCVTPTSTQLTTLIADVLDFQLTQDDGAAAFDAVTASVPSPVTIVTAKGTRRVIIGTRVPASFFDTGGDITGNGEVLLGQQNNPGARQLGSDGTPSRELQGGTNGFTLNIKVDKLTRSSTGSTVSSSMKMSMLFSFVGALYCLL